MIAKIKQWCGLLGFMTSLSAHFQTPSLRDPTTSFCERGGVPAKSLIALWLGLAKLSLGNVASGTTRAVSPSGSRRRAEPCRLSVRLRDPALLSEVRASAPGLFYAPSFLPDFLILFLSSSALTALLLFPSHFAGRI